MAEDELLAVASGAIVVGMDDSDSAREALALAIEEGQRRQLNVLAVTVYTSATAWSREVSKLLDEDKLVGEVQRSARAIVDDVVNQLRERGIEAPSVRVGLRNGPPADVLVRVAREAELLVVGDRGRGELASRLIGSTVLGVVAHATCPVLVVPSPRPGRVTTRH